MIPTASCSRRLALALALAGSLVAPALAQQTTTSGVEEPAARGPRRASAACPGQTRAAGARVAAGCTEDTPGIAPRGAAACTPGTHHGQLRAGAANAPLPLPASPDHRGDKREHGKAAQGVALKTQRPPTQRSKGSVRNAPATPGMGTLLRMGASAGREISCVFESAPFEPLEHYSGRAPPQATALATSAPASLPCASPNTATAVCPGPIPFRPGSLPTPPHFDRCSLAQAASGCPRRNPCRIDPRSGSQLEHVVRSRDSRLEGAPS